MWESDAQERPAAGSYGLARTVFEGDIAELEQDRDYLQRYLRGVELPARSWGCDAEFESLRRFGRNLIDRGEKMHDLRDLSWLFRG